MEDAQQIFGGLESLVRNQETVPEQPFVPAQVSDPVQEKMQEYAKAKLDLINQQKALIDSLQARVSQQPSEKLFAISQALLTPTKTGRITEGIANALGAIQTGQKEEDARRMQLAKMRLELGQQQLGLSKEDIELARQQQGEKILRRMITQEGLPAPTKPEGSEGISQTAAQPSQANFRNITGADLALLSQYNPKLAESLEKAIKIDQDRFVIAQNGVVFDRRAGKYIDIGIPGQKQEDYTIGGKTYRMTPDQYTEFMKANRLGVGQQFLNNLLGAPTGGGPTGIEPKTTAEAAAQAEAAKTMAQRKAELSVQRRDSILNAADIAPRMESLSQANLDLIKANPDAVGVLNAPGISNAILGMLSKIRTSAGVPGSGVSAEAESSAVEDAIRKLGPNKKEGESNEDYQIRRQRTIDAASMLVRNLSEIELVNARSFMKGQGSVSNMERNINKGIGGSISDSMNALLAKSEYLKLVAQYDQMVRDKMLSWEEGAGKNLNVEHFFADKKEYKPLIDEFNKKVSEINSKYFGVKSKAVSPPQNLSLRERLNRELGLQ